MKQTAARRRQAENEVIFRQHNERIKKSFDEIRQLAEEDNQEHLIPDVDDILLHFYCECSDENCRLRIPIDAPTYNKIHKNRRRFVIVPGHETNAIEDIVIKEKSYYVVEKKLLPRVTHAGLTVLNTTDINNV